MQSNNGLMVGLALSAAVHIGAAGACFYVPGQPQRTDTKAEPIEIDFVEYTVRTAPKAAKTRVAPLRKKVAPAPEVQPLPPSEWETKLRAKIKKQEAQLLKLSSDTAVPSAPKATQTSSELLTDPVKGKIFVGYFGSVKHMIQDLLVKKYAKKAIGQGSVYLYFVLNSKGELEKVSVVDRESTADEYLRELAVQCLREAAPFGTFPRSLNTSQISFNVTIYFEQQ